MEVILTIHLVIKNDPKFHKSVNSWYNTVLLYPLPHTPPLLTSPSHLPSHLSPVHSPHHPHLFTPFYHCK